MEKDEKNCKYFGNGRKVMKFWIITLLLYNFGSRKLTNKQNNLLTLTISYEKSYLIRRSKKYKKMNK